jgi:hypothetical protein
VLPSSFPKPAGCTDRYSCHPRSLKSDQPRKKGAFGVISASSGLSRFCVVGPQASAAQGRLLRKDYGGEQSAGLLRGCSFLYTLYIPTWMFRFLAFLWYFPAPQVAPSSALRHACLHGLSAATAFACYFRRTIPLLLIAPLLSLDLLLLCQRSVVVLHVIAATVTYPTEGATLHRAMSRVR